MRFITFIQRILADENTGFVNQTPADKALKQIIYKFFMITRKCL